MLLLYPFGLYQHVSIPAFIPPHKEILKIMPNNVIIIDNLYKICTNMDKIIHRMSNNFLEIKKL